MSFSTADAEYPELTARRGTVVLGFTDWQERRIEVEFHEVCAYRWQEAEQLEPGEPYDGACEVIESAWLAEHRHQEAISVDSGHRHLRFNFNACGQLELLCVSFTLRTPSG